MFYPMFAMVMLTMIIAGRLLFLRVTAVRSGQVHPRIFKLNQSKDIPDRLLQTANNFSNLFEVPIFFYLACLLCIIWQYDSLVMQGLAWLFVTSRVAHSWIHINQNKIIPRLIAFLTSVICVLVMWIILLLHFIAR